MTYKREARKTGRMIRRVTGIDFLLAMEAGKKIARHDADKLTFNKKFEGVLEWQKRCQGFDPDCDCASRWVLKGPKGEYIVTM